MNFKLGIRVAFIFGVVVGVTLLASICFQSSIMPTSKMMRSDDGNELTRSTIMPKSKMMPSDGVNALTRSAILNKNQHQNNTPIYNMTWFRLPSISRFVHDIFVASLDQCEYSNCRLTIGRDNVQQSDVVLFDARWLREGDFFDRRPGQVWIFTSDESPSTFHYNGGRFSREPWVSSFNWTMTYDKSNSDIHFPYGKIVPNSNKVDKDYKRIYDSKNRTALIVHSYCNPMSNRPGYLALLQKHVSGIDSMGNCGTPWRCGLRNRHDAACFDIVNYYMFYLAFENAFCDHYFTEKLFENYNYDSIMVVRGGRYNDIKQILPPGTYISTDGFKSVIDLADYLNKVAGSEALYTEILRRKDQYYSVKRQTVYQKAMCDVCERMNKQDQYRYSIADINTWAYKRNPCLLPSDLNETVS